MAFAALAFAFAFGGLVTFFLVDLPDGSGVGDTGCSFSALRSTAKIHFDEITMVLRLVTQLCALVNK